MRKFIWIVVFVMMTSAAYAQRVTLIQEDDSWNAFSKFHVGFSEIDNNSAKLAGVTAGGLWHDRLGIGLAVRSTFDTVETRDPLLKDLSSWDFWYGGLYLEYVCSNAKNLIYGSADLLIGGGRLEVDRFTGGAHRDSVFIVEPGLNVMINITQRFMFGVGASYRFVEGVDVPGLSDNRLSNVSGNVFVRFTQF
jgi:hypothetical protein